MQNKASRQICTTRPSDSSSPFPRCVKFKTHNILPKEASTMSLSPTTSAEKRQRESEDSLQDAPTKKRKTTPTSQPATTYTSEAELHPLPHLKQSELNKPTALSPATSTQSEDVTPYLKKIAFSHKTPFQKRVLTALCQVPRGQYSTYGALAKHLSSSPRAVGNALRNNPFAPYVPCHRVLATGGAIGGFKGSWGRNGKEGINDGEKRRLLREEGVRFDGRGRVVGSAWEGFG